MGGAERQITMANEGGAAEKWDWRRDMKVALAFFGAVKRYVFPLLATVPLRGGRCSSTLWTLRSPTCAPSVVVRRRRSAPFPHIRGWRGRSSAPRRSRRTGSCFPQRSSGRLPQRSAQSGSRGEAAAATPTSGLAAWQRVRKLSGEGS